MTDEEIEEQRVEQEQKVYLLPFAKDRYEKCKVCEDFFTTIRVCKQCYCFMPAKVLLPGVTCPKGVW